MPNYSQFTGTLKVEPRIIIYDFSFCDALKIYQKRLKKYSQTHLDGSISASN